MPHSSQARADLAQSRVMEHAMRRLLACRPRPFSTSRKSSILKLPSSPASPNTLWQTDRPDIAARSEADCGQCANILGSRARRMFDPHLGAKAGFPEPAKYRMVERREPIWAIGPNA